MTPDHIKQIADIITEDPNVLLELDERLRELERQAHTDQNIALRFIVELHKVDQLNINNLLYIISYHKLLVSKLIEQAVQVIRNAAEALDPTEEPTEFWNVWNFEYTLTGEERVQHILNILDGIFKTKGELGVRRAGYGGRMVWRSSKWGEGINDLGEHARRSENQALEEIANGLVTIGDIVRFNQSQKSQRQLINYLERIPERFPSLTVDVIVHELLN